MSRASKSSNVQAQPQHKLDNTTSNEQNSKSIENLSKKKTEAVINVESTSPLNSAQPLTKEDKEDLIQAYAESDQPRLLSQTSHNEESDREELKTAGFNTRAVVADDDETVIHELEEENNPEDEAQRQSLLLKQ